VLYYEAASGIGAFMGYKRLARDIQRARRTTIDYVAELHWRGLLAIERRPYPFTNLFKPTWPLYDVGPPSPKTEARPSKAEAKPYVGPRKL
jgi:hypothetical protein